MTATTYFTTSKAFQSLRNIYQQFNGIAGAAYFVAGFGITALTSSDEHMVVVPIRSGLGLRLGYNVGYLKFTASPTLNPF